MQDAAKGTLIFTAKLNHTIAIGMSECTPQLPTMMHIDSDTCDGISPMPYSALQQEVLRLTFISRLSCINTYTCTHGHKCYYNTLIYHNIIVGKLWRRFDNKFAELMIHQ